MLVERGLALAELTGAGGGGSDEGAFVFGDAWAGFGANRDKYSLGSATTGADIGARVGNENVSFGSCCSYATSPSTAASAS